MKTFLDCIPCFFKQALRTVRMSTGDEKTIKRLLDEIGMMLKDISLESTPPETGRLIYQKIREITGDDDPYKAIKKKSTERALAMYSPLKSKVEKSADPLLTAVRVAIAGNVIDLGVYDSVNIEEEVSKIIEMDFAICDYEDFGMELERTDRILFLGDNAGESVFDRILIEQINKPTTYVVRHVPIINDVTYEDAVQAGIDKSATIVSSGTDAPGIILNTCNAEFVELFNDSDFIISKGQGNYEGLSGETRRLFFLLMAKCPVIADHIGVNTGSLILKASGLKHS